MSKNKNQNQVRYGLVYKNHGGWTKTPYNGETFTKYTISRDPVKSYVQELKQHVLKTAVKWVPVTA